jgi:hypothetical protein
VFAPALRTAAVALEPGRYLLLCTMTEDERRHFDLGMIDRFTIE